jgi:hypothetical protein
MRGRSRSRSGRRLDCAGGAGVAGRPRAHNRGWRRHGCCGLGRRRHRRSRRTRRRHVGAVLRLRTVGAVGEAGWLSVPIGASGECAQANPTAPGLCVPALRSGGRRGRHRDHRGLLLALLRVLRADSCGRARHTGAGSQQWVARATREYAAARAGAHVAWAAAVACPSAGRSTQGPRAAAWAQRRIAASCPAHPGMRAAAPTCPARRAAGGGSRPAARRTAAGRTAACPAAESVRKAQAHQARHASVRPARRGAGSARVRTGAMPGAFTIAGSMCGAALTCEGGCRASGRNRRRVS